jgi:Family of unknown function (DUF5670)
MVVSLSRNRNLEYRKRSDLEITIGNKDFRYLFGYRSEGSLNTSRQAAPRIAPRIQQPRDVPNGLPRCSRLISPFILQSGAGAPDLNPEKEKVMLAAIAAVLLVLWLLGFLAFHVTFGLIHFLLVFAIILFVMHFVTGRGAAV